MGRGYDDIHGPVFNIPISASALTTAGAYDLFSLVADSSARFELLKIDLQLATTQSSTMSAISLQLMRGSTTPSTGVAITPVNVRGQSAAPTAALTATSPCTTLMSTASATVLAAGAFNNIGQYSFKPEPIERPVMALSQRLNLRTSTPQIAASVAGTVTVREIGKGLPS